MFDLEVLPHRIHFIELHEQPWCPAIIRDLVVQTLHLLWTAVPLPSMSMAHTVLVSTLREIVVSTKSTQIVDLCSGGGGPMPYVAERLGIPLTLTDLYPQSEHWKKAFNGKLVTWSSDSVDAMNMPRKYAVPGVLRTFCLSLHHFRPEQVAAMLSNAVAHRHPVVMIEAQQRIW